MYKNRSFDDVTAEHLAHYIYCLIDPRNGRAFYVGKGQKNRIFGHEGSIDLNESEEIVRAKDSRIFEIRKAGLEVHEVILRHGLKSDREAFEIEAAVIDFCLCQDLPLTNLQGGHESGDFGLMSVDDVRSLYHAKSIEYFDEKAITLNIGRQYVRHQSPQEIFDKTHRAWVLNVKRASEATLAIATAHGIIRGVFRIHNWYVVRLDDSLKGKTRQRYAFEGEAEQELWQHYVGKSVPVVRGTSNPIRYADTPSKTHPGKYWFEHKVADDAA